MCKEDKETLTKSKITTTLKVFHLLNLALEKFVTNEKKPMQEWINGCLENGLKFGLKPGEGDPIPQQFFVETAIYIVLIPQVFKI